MARGHVEKNVQDARPRLPTPPVASWAELSRSGPDFPDLAALNAWLEHRCVDLWRDIPHGVQPGTIAGVWAGEQLALMALPPALAFCFCATFVRKPLHTFRKSLYLAVIQRKPAALRNDAPFASLPAPCKQLQDHIQRKPGGDREMADVPALVLHHDEPAVLTAVAMALEAGVPTKTHVLNLLHRLIDGKTTGGPDVDTPVR